MTETGKAGPRIRHIRLLLAREPGHPAGSRLEGYDILAPLDAEGRIDAADWKQNQATCRVRHFRPGEEDRIGRLRRKSGGQWYFDYEEGLRDDEVGFQFDDERFVTGEYVSVSHAGKMQTYQIARVEKP